MYTTHTHPRNSIVYEKVKNGGGQTFYVGGFNIFLIDYVSPQHLDIH